MQSTSECNCGRFVKQLFVAGDSERVAFEDKLNATLTIEALMQRFQDGPVLLGRNDESLFSVIATTSLRRLPRCLDVLSKLLYDFFRSLALVLGTSYK